METDTTWASIVTAIGSIVTPLLVLVLSGIGWRLRSISERRLELEKELRIDRAEIYNDILEPFVILLMSDVAWRTDSKNKNRNKNEIATEKLLSVEYRKKAFKMTLIGSEDVVTSYNDLMQHFFNADIKNTGSVSNDKANDGIELLGKFLLAIRKNIGNEATKLNHWQMLEWFIIDARKYRLA